MEITPITRLNLKLRALFTNRKSITFNLQIRCSQTFWGVRKFQILLQAEKPFSKISNRLCTRRPKALNNFCKNRKLFHWKLQRKDSQKLRQIQKFLLRVHTCVGSSICRRLDRQLTSRQDLLSKNSWLRNLNRLFWQKVAENFTNLRWHINEIKQR